MRDPHSLKSDQAVKQPVRTRPSAHLLATAVIFSLAILGYAAIIWSGALRGFEPSNTVAGRDIALMLTLLGFFLWLVRRQRYRGEMILLTAAVFLFVIGSLVQYRLFSDPEYGARGGERASARLAKAQATRLLNIRTGYEDEKKVFLFGDADRVPEEPHAARPSAPRYTVADILTSTRTYVPLAAFAVMSLTFLLFKRDSVLLWLQRRALLIGVSTLVPFAVVVLFFSDEGRFFGQTTPWEPVKILFLLSFAGILSDSYRHLRRTRWGLPPARYLLPFLVIAAMPVLPFFVLSDFGQMLVFFGVYLMLYMVAVRKGAQLAYATMLIVVIFGIFFAASSITTGFGLPARVHFRFYQWVDTWTPPSTNTWWWRPDYERYVRLKNLQPDPGDESQVSRVNREAWSDKVLQQSQGLFGITEGGLMGEGLGLGFPETVPISDSDFIYAAIAEEMGLLGGVTVLLAIATLIIAGTAVSTGAGDMLSKLVSGGLTCFIGFQAIVNIGGVVRLLPMTGITLPFVSHGGWSLITSFAMLGMLLAFSHRNALAAVRTPATPEYVPVR